MVINENLVNVVNILTLIAMFSSITWSIHKKKYDTAILLGVLTFLFITFKFILKVFK